MKCAAYFRYCSDQSKIQSARPAHREYLSGLKSQGKLVMAGPFAEESGALIVYNAPTLEEAQRLIEDDPFHTAGVFESYRIKVWNQVM